MIYAYSLSFCWLQYFEVLDLMMQGRRYNIWMYCHYKALLNCWFGIWVFKVFIETKVAILENDIASRKLFKENMIISFRMMVNDDQDCLCAFPNQKKFLCELKSCCNQLTSHPMIHLQGVPKWFWLSLLLQCRASMHTFS